MKTRVPCYANDASTASAYITQTHTLIHTFGGHIVSHFSFSLAVASLSLSLFIFFASSLFPFNSPHFLMLALLRHGPSMGSLTFFAVDSSDGGGFKSFVANFTFEFHFFFISETSKSAHVNDRLKEGKKYR